MSNSVNFSLGISGPFKNAREGTLPYSVDTLFFRVLQLFWQFNWACALEFQCVLREIDAFTTVLISWAVDMYLAKRVWGMHAFWASLVVLVTFEIKETLVVLVFCFLKSQKHRRSSLKPALNCGPSSPFTPTHTH